MLLGLEPPDAGTIDIGETVRVGYYAQQGLSFDENALVENFKAVAEEVKRLKPSTVKGRYITKVTITSTMAPGVPGDPMSLV